MLTLSTAALLAALEAEYLGVEAQSRWPVLMFIMTFDVICYCFRICAKCTTLYWRTGEQHRRRCSVQHSVTAAGACPATTIGTACKPCAHRVAVPPLPATSRRGSVIFPHGGGQGYGAAVCQHDCAVHTHRAAQSAIQALGRHSSTSGGRGRGRHARSCFNTQSALGRSPQVEWGRHLTLIWPPADTQGCLHPEYTVSPSLNQPHTQSAVC